MADPTFGWDVCKMKGCMAMLAPRAGVVTFAPNHTLILCTTQHSSPEAKFEILRILQTMKMSCWSGSNTLILTTGRQMVPRSFLWDPLQSWSECFLWGPRGWVRHILGRAIKATHLPEWPPIPRWKNAEEPTKSPATGCACTYLWQARSTTRPGSSWPRVPILPSSAAHCLTGVCRTWRSTTMTNRPLAPLLLAGSASFSNNLFLYLLTTPLPLQWKTCTLHISSNLLILSILLLISSLQPNVWPLARPHLANRRSPAWQIERAAQLCFSRLANRRSSSAMLLFLNSVHALQRKFRWIDQDFAL